MKNFDKCQRAYDNMAPEGPIRKSYRPSQDEDDARASQELEERLAEKKSKQLGRYVYTPEEAEALNKLGW